MDHFSVFKLVLRSVQIMITKKRDNSENDQSREEARDGWMKKAYDIEIVQKHGEEE